MGLTCTSPPAALPVTLAEMRDHVRVDADGSPATAPDDATLARYIAAATARLDGRDGFLGRALVMQTWRLTLPAFLAEIPLPLPPCQAVDAVSFADPTGAVQILDPDAYQVAGLGGADMAVLRPAYGTCWPSTRAVPEAVLIDFTAGFGDGPEDVPEALRQAVRMLAAHFYETREAVIAATGFVKETPMGFEDLIRDFRLWAF